jgi:hypothetical protein
LPLVVKSDVPCPSKEAVSNASFAFETASLSFFALPSAVEILGLLFSKEYGKISTIFRTVTESVRVYVNTWEAL